MKTLLDKVLGLTPMMINSNPGPNVTTTAISQDLMEVAAGGGVASGDGQYVGKSAKSLIGFWGAVPAVQPASAAGDIHTVAAGAGAAVKVDTSFDGSVGATAYTIGDLVANLKAAGILAL